MPAFNYQHCKSNWIGRCFFPVYQDILLGMQRGCARTDHFGLSLLFPIFLFRLSTLHVYTPWCHGTLVLYICERSEQSSLGSQSSKQTSTNCTLNFKITFSVGISKKNRKCSMTVRRFLPYSFKTRFYFTVVQNLVKNWKNCVVFQLLFDTSVSTDDPVTVTVTSNTLTNGNNTCSSTRVHPLCFTSFWT